MIRFGSTHIQISAYTYHYGDRGAYDNSISDRGNLLLGTSAAHTHSPALVLDVHHLHPPGVGHLLLSLCPTGDLGEKATFRPDPPPGEPRLIADAALWATPKEKKKGAVDAALTLRCSSPAWPQRTTEPVYCSLILTSEIKHILILSINLIIH